MKYILVDNKVRDIELEYFNSLNYEVIKIPTNTRLYDEISSHTDIHVCKLKDKVIVSKELYNYLDYTYFKNNIYVDLRDKIIVGNSYVLDKYPLDIKYNLFQFKSYVIHNFNYTDEKCLNVIDNLKLKKIDVNQGYSNCSCLNILDKICLTCDIDIYNKLNNELIKDLKLIYVDKEKCNINLIKNNGKYSNMKGFIGGCLSVVDGKLIVFGDSKYIYNFDEIKEVLDNNNIKLIEFKGYKLIDYGKIIEV